MRICMSAFVTATNATDSILGFSFREVACSSLLSHSPTRFRIPIRHFHKHLLRCSIIFALVESIRRSIASFFEEFQADISTNIWEASGSFSRWIHSKVNLLVFRGEMTAQGPDPSGNPPAPFLTKCYDMVNDASTEATVSWSPAGDTFVVWDPPAFSRDLLPKYFKHGNFSSFVRQLNTYGFRKVDPDRWEFSNEGFRQGQKNLLKSIARRKQTQSLTQQRQLSHESTTPVGACVEVGKFGLEEEIERLKRDKNVLAQELVKLRQHQQSTDLLVRDLRRRVQGMEQHQQQMLSFFVMAMQRPGFFAQLLQQNDRLLSDASKKRRLPALEQGIEDVCASAGGQIVKYEPLKNENSKPLIMPVSDSNLSPAPVPSFDGANDLFENIDWASLGIDMSLPMEVDVHSSEADGTFVFLEISNDELEQLLMTTSYSENSEEKGPGILEPDDYGLQFEASEKKTPSETPQNLDLLTEQMGHLTSELNRDSEPA